MLVILLSIAAASAAGLALANDKEMATDIRLVETADEVRFEFEGPDYVFPTLSIDMNRNSVVDRNIDFNIGFESSDGSPCLQMWLAAGQATVCKPFGDKAKVTRTKMGGSTLTIYALPKRQVSKDGRGFGFAVALFDKRDHFETWPVAGVYPFGGTVELVGDGPNFLGQQNPNVPGEMVPAMRLYQSCFSAALHALEPIVKSKMVLVKEIPANCARTKDEAFAVGVESLVTAGYERASASQAMQQVLDNIADNMKRFISVLEQRT